MNFLEELIIFFLECLKHILGSRVTISKSNHCVWVYCNVIFWQHIENVPVFVGAWHCRFFLFQVTLAWLLINLHRKEYSQCAHTVASKNNGLFLILIVFGIWLFLLRFFLLLSPTSNVFFFSTSAYTLNGNT